MCRLQPAGFFQRAGAYGRAAYANSDNVSPATQAPATAEQPAVDTPETGDSRVLYLIGALGLVLICSAGLLLLRRI